jgi:hypothetical protein
MFGKTVIECSNCEGSGKKSHRGKTYDCPMCHGTGQLIRLNPIVGPIICGLIFVLVVIGMYSGYFR